MTRVISAGVSEELAEQLEDHREDGESRSKTIDRLLRAGLDREQTGRTITLGTWLMWVGSLLFVAAYVDAGTTTGQLGLAAVALGAVSNQDRIDRARRSVKARYNELQDLSGRSDTDGNG